jgi:hypothetical protein
MSRSLEEPRSILSSDTGLVVDAQSRATSRTMRRNALPHWQKRHTVVASSFFFPKLTSSVIDALLSRERTRTVSCRALMEKSMPGVYAYYSLELREG